MRTQCLNCGAALSDPGRDFACPRCGHPVRSAGGGFVADEEAMGLLAAVQMSDEPGWKALLLVLQRLSRLLAFALFYLLLGLCFIALFVGIPKVLAGAPGSDLAAVIYILTPAPVGFLAFGGGPLAAYHVFLAAVIVASLANLLYRERRRLRALLSESAGRFRSPDRKSPLGVVQLPQVFLAIFFFDVGFALALAATGTATRAPPFETYPDWYLYFTFANASVYEEFAARVLLLGLPLMLAYLLAFRWRPLPDLLPYAAIGPAGTVDAGAAGPPGPVAPPPAPAPPAPKPDPLVDGLVGDPTTRLVPKPDDTGAPVAATPAFKAPLEAPPPVAPAKTSPSPPPLPFPETALTAAAPSQARQQPPSASASPWQTAVTAPPPGGGSIHARGREPPVPSTSPLLTPLGYLRSRTANGLWGYILGGGFKIGPLEAFFIAGSALMFGLAHVAGWDIFKALPTFIAGLGFGYLFLKVGIHAAILLHFAFDYLSLGEALLPGFAPMEVIILVLFSAVGAFYFGHYTVQAARWFTAQLAKGT